MGDCEGLRLEALRSFSVLDSQADAAIDRLVRLAGSLFDTPIALVSLIDENRQWFKAKLGLSASETPRDQAFCAHAIAMGPEAVMVVEDAAADPRFADNPLVIGAPDIRFYAGATLTTKDGHNLGTLCVIDDKPRPRPDEAALERLKLLARIVVDEFELARAHRRTQEKQRLLELAETMAGVGHWRMDLSIGVVTWSDAVFAIHGLDRAAFDPNLDDAVAFYHPDDRDLVRRRLTLAQETKTSFDFQLRLIRADGALRHVVCRGMCELDEQGRATALFGLFQDVTETVETIATLRRRKSRYRLVTEHAGDVITRYDFAGNGKFISPAIEKLLGYTVAETAGLTVPSVLNPDDREAVMAVFAEMSRGLDQRTVQHRSRHKRGYYVWVESNLQLVRDEAGAPKEIVCVSRDISDRKALELDLIAARDDAREQAQRALLAEDIAGLGHWRYDLRTHQLDVSRKMFEIYGLPCVERPDMAAFQQCIHPDERDWTQARIAERLRTGEPDYNVLTRIVRPDGEERCVSGSSITVNGVDGAPAFMMGTVRDITDEHGAKIALSDSETRYRLLAQNSTDIIVTCALTGEITFASPAIAAVGYDPEALIGKTAMSFAHPEDAPAILKTFQQVVAGQPPTRLRWRGRHRLEGRWVWFESNPVLLRDPTTGAPNGYLDVVRDISAQKAQEDALAQARQDAERAMRSKADFLANMSHELRTPLNSIIGFSCLLAERDTLNPEDRRQIDLVHGAGQALHAVIDNVLDFSKLEASALALDPAPFDVVALVRKTLALLEPQAADKAVTLVFEHDGPSQIFVQGDQGRLRQVVLNYLSNAVKFTSGGQVTARLDVQAVRDREVPFRISVRDTGAGIAADKLAGLFTRFAQAEASTATRYGGTGLGLAISKQLIALMGGEVGVESRLGEGSTFWLDLALPAAAAPVTAPGADAAPSSFAGRSILVVDDVDLNRQLMATLLAKQGCVVETAENGAEAVARMTERRFDLVLMDCQMPVMDGFAATCAVRAGPVAYADTPIVALTASAHPEHLARCEAAGMDAHLTKPLNPDALQATLLRFLSASPLAKAAPVVTDATRQALVDSLGAAACATLLDLFIGQLDVRLTGEETTSLRDDAHALAGSCGLMGYDGLSEACRALEQRIAEGADHLSALAESRRQADFAREDARHWRLKLSLNAAAA